MVWILKLVVKLIVFRLPFLYKTWAKLGFFRHGQMDSCEYALKIFFLHLYRAFPNGVEQDATFLELGPGDSVASAVIASTFGVSKTYLVDVGDFATKDVSFYQLLISRLYEQKYNPINAKCYKNFQDVLKTSRGVYLTNGIADLKKIPSKSIDFIYSHSVLEHVKKDELFSVLLELRRIMKDGGISSHCIDYQDHLNFSLNNLRFPRRIWESNFFWNSGFYTNRVPAKIMHKMFECAGFQILQEEFGCWEILPTPRHLMDKEFLEYKDEDLINRTSSVVLRAST